MAFFDGIGSALIGGAISLGSGLLSSRAAGKAADAQVQAANTSAQVLRDQFNQTRADNQNTRAIGERAQFALADALGISRPYVSTALPFGVEADLGSIPQEALAATTPQVGFQQSPGYQYQLDEGMKAIRRAAAARGLLGSGTRLKEAGRFATSLANQDYNNYLNRLASFGGLSQSVNQNTNALGANAAQGLAQSALDAGTARASGFAGQSNAITGTANNLLALLLSQGR